MCPPAWGPEYQTVIMGQSSAVLYSLISTGHGADRLRAGAFGRTVGLSAPDEAATTIPEEAPPVQQPLAPQKQYAANMGSIIRALTRSRANGQLLHDSEWRAYEEAIASGRYARHCTALHCISA